MEKEKLTHIAHLTDINNHGEARVYIAEQFEYLGQKLKQLKLINELHEEEGSLHYDLQNYRKHITDEMLDIIERKEGKEVAEQIYKCL